VVVTRRFTSLLCLCLALLLWGPVTISAAADRPPNILIIVTDDQRFDQMGAMPRTNALFKAGGVTFPNTYAGTPLCCPSRASIFSGRYSHNTGVRGNTVDEVNHLDLRYTLQHALKAAGYQTGIVGKIFNGWKIDRNPPDFDRWAVMRGGYTNAQFNVDGKLTTQTGYSTDFISNHAKSMLDQFQRDPNKPWFLYVAPFAPHFPYTPHAVDTAANVGTMPDNAALHEKDKGDKPPWIANFKPVDLGRTPAQVWQDQNRSLIHVDRMVQRLFANQSKPNDTLAIFISDNGYLLGEHGVVEDKRLPYTESIHVPMLMRWPARLKGGTVDTRYAMNVDIAPTIAEAARLSTRWLPKLDGRSLLGSYRRDRVYLEGFNSKENPYDAGYPAWTSTLNDDVQYTEWTGPQGKVAFRELYNRRTDPDQLVNLFWLAPTAAANYAAPTAKHLARLRSSAGTTGATACT